MRKFVFFALFVSFLCAESELKQPLSAKSAPQKALTNSQESTLQKNEQKAVNSAQNESTPLNSNSQDLQNAQQSTPLNSNAQENPPLNSNQNQPLNSNPPAQLSTQNLPAQLENSAKQSVNSTDKPITQNSSLAEDDEPNIYDFAKIATREYNGEDTTINILRIKTHDTNYFLPFAYTFHGRPNDPKYKQAETKFQFSVKKVLFENVLFLGESWNFGYTQTAWWQMYAESAPFRELNYAPELFVSFPFSGFGWLKSMSVGFMHQSNGKDGADSRSWNRVYANAVFHHKRFVFLPRLWYIVPESSLDENKDIRKYLGNFDAKIAYLGRDTFAYILLRNNLNFKHNKGAVEINAGFDLFDNGVFWFVQYFNGYGESLIDYQRYINKLGIGFVVAY